MGVAWNKILEPVGLAGDERITRDGMLAITERMEGRKAQSRRPVENGGRTGGEKVALAGVLVKPRGHDAELAADVERETCDGECANNSEQTGKRRGIGYLEVR